MNTSDFLTAVTASQDSGERTFLIVMCCIGFIFLTFVVRMFLRPNCSYPDIAKKEGFLWNNLPYWIWALTTIPALLLNLILPYIYILWLLARIIVAGVMILGAGMVYRDGKSERRFKDICIWLKLAGANKS